MINNNNKRQQSYSVIILNLSRFNILWEENVRSESEFCKINKKNNFINIRVD